MNNAKNCENDSQHMLSCSTPISRGRFRRALTGVLMAVIALATSGCQSGLSVQVYQPENRLLPRIRFAKKCDLHTAENLNCCCEAKNTPSAAPAAVPAETQETESAPPVVSGTEYGPAPDTSWYRDSENKLATDSDHASGEAVVSTSESEAQFEPSVVSRKPLRTKSAEQNAFEEPSPAEIAEIFDPEPSEANNANDVPAEFSRVADLPLPPASPEPINDVDRPKPAFVRPLPPIEPQSQTQGIIIRALPPLDHARLDHNHGAIGRIITESNSPKATICHEAASRDTTPR